MQIEKEKLYKLKRFSRLDNNLHYIYIKPLIRKTMKNILRENMRRFGTKNLNEEEPTNLPEVNVSAWTSLPNALKRANAGDKILLYIYNDGCSHCENFTQTLMKYQPFRKALSGTGPNNEGKTVLAKIMMCRDEENNKYMADRATRRGLKKDDWVPCPDPETKEMNDKLIKSIQQQTSSAYAIPFLGILDASGNVIEDVTEFAKPGRRQQIVGRLQGEKFTTPDE